MKLDAKSEGIEKGDKNNSDFIRSVDSDTDAIRN